MKPFLLTAATSVVLLAAACEPGPGSAPTADGAPVGLKAAADAFYDAYGKALSEPKREAIAGFYHPDGALILLDGDPRRMTRAAIDSTYRTQWSPPAYFAWERLAFDSLSPRQIIVTGHFLWQSAGQPDTGRFVYAAVLERVDSGLAIRFEHETSAPRR